MRRQKKEEARKRVTGLIEALTIQLSRPIKVFL